MGNINVGKKSYRQLARELKDSTIKLQSTQEQAQTNFKILFMLAVRLKEITPEDDLFRSGVLEQELIKLIDQEVNRRQEARNKPVIENTEESKLVESENYPSDDNLTK